MPIGRTRGVLTLLAVVAMTAAPASGGPVDPAPPLPPPSGRVVQVKTESELRAAVAAVTSNTTIVVAPGTYRLTRSLYFRGVRNVTLRGASNDRDATVLVGAGMRNERHGDVPYGVWAGDGVEDLMVANLTLRDFYFHPIILNAGVTRARIYNVHLIDAGQQFLKSNPGADGRGNDQGRVEHSVFEFTTTGRDDYPKAIDIHGARGWVIRDNLFRNIRAPRPLLNGPAVLAWRGSRDTIVEGNTFINCQREIVIGAENVEPASHEGGVVRNNFIYRDATVRGDAAISVWGSPRTVVAHNTILLSGTYASAIEVRWEKAASAAVINNLSDAAVILRNGAQAAIVGNVTTAQVVDFLAPATGDLHVKPGVAPRRGAFTDAAPTDWDGRPRPPAPDVGASQRDEPSPKVATPARR